MIVTDPQADARLWAEVLNRGGYDLLTQPFYAPEVRRILGNAVSRGLSQWPPYNGLFPSRRPCPPPPTPLFNRTATAS